ncbi:hypothetical protein CDA63_06240 [Hymenobacter amundsenii]|uniref:Uncharacterized protein n=1 Tax=Hymenobacter amundsenii TaxID=2006685 RepID=A0A246FN03_9BACT|nr:hypothetical protein [Hymenobacter amundsenii]OWP64059.1 hypothetical protein CDA63_06240 [Hymenobacter amundsenii]
MRISFDVPDHRASFILELLRSLPFVSLRGQAAKAVGKTEPDTTDYLLASPANAAHLARSLAHLERGEGITVDLSASE